MKVIFITQTTTYKQSGVSSMSNSMNVSFTVFFSENLIRFAQLIFFGYDSLE